MVFFVLFFTEHLRTEFTKFPPKTIVAKLGSDVEFHWRLSFAAGSMDRLHFQDIIWGTSDDDNIRDKYITVSSDGKTKKNTQHSEKERQRWGVSGNITQTETNQVFVLKSVTKSDAEKTYGCMAIVWGEWISSGPIHLKLKGKICSVGQSFPLYFFISSVSYLSSHHFMVHTKVLSPYQEIKLALNLHTMIRDNPYWFIPQYTSSVTIIVTIVIIIV